jgi:hypothetical protein
MRDHNRQVSDWWLDLRDSLILYVTTLYCSLSHTHTHARTHTHTSVQSSSLSLLGSSFQPRMLPFLWVSKLSLASATSFQLQGLTINWTPAVPYLPVTESESYVTSDSQSASVSWYKAQHPSGAYDQIFISVQNTEYVWQLRSWFRGAPSLMRGRVCLLYVPLALASAVFLGS